MGSYIAVLVAEHDEAGRADGYSVFFPDVPGCVTQGEDMAEAHSMAIDALSLWMATARDLGRKVPDARSLEEIQADKAWAKENAVDWKTATAMVVQLRPPLGKPERVNVSLDSNRLRAIDAYANRRGMTRSAVLEQGAALLMERDLSAPAKEKGKSGQAPKLFGRTGAGIPIRNRRVGTGLAEERVQFELTSSTRRRKK